ncbi:MAG: hypothetical protein GQF41_0439 [Candidatus Rifleibacterium amylolyticum]|nr:MAG: hypothetical protein GQF41_0439 [Candidatus Rifleibacterium amylolyticum]
MPDIDLSPGSSFEVRNDAASAKKKSCLRGCGCSCLLYIIGFILFISLVLWSVWKLLPDESRDKLERRIESESTRLESSARSYFRELTGKDLDLDSLKNKGRRFIDEAAQTVRGDPPPQPPRSKVPALDVTPLAGVRIIAPAGSLDRPRSFTVNELSEADQEKLFQKEQKKNVFPLKAFQVDCGMSAADRFAGSVKISFDLAKHGFPAESWEDLRLGAVLPDGSLGMLNSKLDNGILYTRTRHNSVIVILGAVIIPAGTAYLASQELESLPDGTFSGKYSRIEWNPARGRIILRYPSSWPAADPEEMKSWLDQMSGVLRRHCGTRTKNGWEVSRVRFLTSFLAITRDPEYRALKKQFISPGWMLKNFLPKKAGLVAKAMDRSIDYLEGRNFRMPGYGGMEWVTEVYITEKSMGGSVFGEARNPRSMRSFLVMDGTKIPDSSEEDLSGSQKTQFDTMQTTAVHEFFHACQVAYVAVEWKSYLWFFEATAVMLESEAFKYFQQQGWASTWDHTPRQNSIYYQTYHRNPDASDAEIRQHGYGGATFLEFLRDRCCAGDPDSFLKLLLDDFSAWNSDPLKAILSSSGLNEDKLGAAFGDFAATLYPEIIFTGKHHEGSIPGGIDLTPGQKRVVYPRRQNHILSARGIQIQLKIKDFKPEELQGALIVARDSVGQQNPEVQTALSAFGSSWQKITPGAAVSLPVADVSGKNIVPVLVRRVCATLKDLKGNGGTDVFLLTKPAAPKLAMSADNLVIHLPRPKFAGSFAEVDGLGPCLEKYELYISAGKRLLTYKLPAVYEPEGWKQKLPELKKELKVDPAAAVNVSVWYREVASSRDKIFGPESAKASINLVSAPVEEKRYISLSFKNQMLGLVCFWIDGTRIGGRLHWYTLTAKTRSNPQITRGENVTGSYDPKTRTVNGKAIVNLLGSSQSPPMTFEFTLKLDPKPAGSGKVLHAGKATARELDIKVFNRDGFYKWAASENPMKGKMRGQWWQFEE